MKNERNHRIYLLPEKRKRSLSGMPARLYRVGWLVMAIAFAALIAVYLMLRGIQGT